MKMEKDHACDNRKAEKAKKPTVLLPTAIIT